MTVIEEQVKSVSLTEQLADLKKQMGREIPREILVEIDEFVKELDQSDLGKNCCQTGDTMPGFSLPGVSGQVVSSDKLLADGPLVLSFYRGIW